MAPMFPVLLVLLFSLAQTSAHSVPRTFATDSDFLEFVQKASFDFFWDEANPTNGLVRDRTQTNSFCSIAAVGFGLTALGIGIDHGWITRAEGYERARRTVRTFWELPQGPEASGVGGHRGWFYHFLDMNTGLRFRQVELSSIDSALLFAGMIYAAEYFNRPEENELRELTGKLLARVDWKWMLNGDKTLTMGWHPETGFIEARWRGYNEASILYIIALGVENPALDRDSWTEWTRTYDWRTSYGYSFVHFAPLFGHQYSACWIDFRNSADEYMRAKGITYFENSRRATLAQRAYCIANPLRHTGYSSNVWGLTACDGPGVKGTFAYMARGAPPPENDDGTIAPTAAGGSIPFAPRECIAALRHMYDTYREKIWHRYGFRDAFNLRHDWWDPDVLGIDQGPILIMAENHRNGRVWDVMNRSKILQRGLNRAGFAPMR